MRVKVVRNNNIKTQQGVKSASKSDRITVDDCRRNISPTSKEKCKDKDIFVYLIPKKISDKGVVLEYKIERHEMDLGQKYCVIHEKHRLSSWILVEKLFSYSLMKRMDDTLIAPDEKIAYAFQRELENSLRYEV